MSRYEERRRQILREAFQSLALNLAGLCLVLYKKGLNADQTAALVAPEAVHAASQLCLAAGCPEHTRDVAAGLIDTAADLCGRMLDAGTAN